MPKAVMLSIRPRYCEMIAGNFKSIEVRKTRPKIETPFKCYIYCTNSGRPLVYGDKPCADGWTEAYTQTYGYSREEADKIWGVMNGKVIGEFVCDRVERFDVPFPAYMDQVDTQQLKAAHLSYIEAHTYLGHRSGYGWHISNLVIYDEPKKLTDFIRPSGGCCNEGKCTGCKYLDKGNGYNVEDDCLADFDTDSYSIVTRPPQSYCYVEELE